MASTVQSNDSISVIGQHFEQYWPITDIEPVPNHALWCLSIEWILESNSKQASQDRSDGYKISTISCGANFSSFLVQSPKGTFTVSVMSPMQVFLH